MAVMMTDQCINCDACIDECPATAIVSAADSGREHTYVHPEKCIECADCAAPKCADVCPSDGAIAWDQAYTPENRAYFLAGHEAGIYTIRTHKTKGLLLPDIAPKAYRDYIPASYRSDHAAVSVDEMNRLMIERGRDA